MRLRTVRLVGRTPLQFIRFLFYLLLRVTGGFLKEFAGKKKSNTQGGGQVWYRYAPSCYRSNWRARGETTYCGAAVWLRVAFLNTILDFALLRRRTPTARHPLAKFLTRLLQRARFSGINPSACAARELT